MGPQRSFELVMNGVARLAARKAALLLLPAWLVISGCGGSFLWGWAARSEQPEISSSEFERLHEQAQLAPDEPYWSLQLAELHLAAGNADSAQVYCDEALRRRPEYAPALSLRSQLYWNAGEHEQAVALLEEAQGQLSAFPEELSVALALHLDAMGDFESADALFTQLPAETPALRELDGYRQLRGDDYLHSLEKAEALAKAHQDVAEHQNNYGIALLYAGRPHEARQVLERARELDPSLPGPYYNLAIVERFYFFEEDAARDHLRSYLRLASDDPDGLAALFAQDDEDTTEDAK